MGTSRAGEGERPPTAGTPRANRCGRRAEPMRVLSATGCGASGAGVCTQRGLLVGAPGSGEAAGPQALRGRSSSLFVCHGYGVENLGLAPRGHLGSPAPSGRCSHAPQWRGAGVPYRQSSLPQSVRSQTHPSPHAPLGPWIIFGSNQNTT